MLQFSKSLHIKGFSVNHYYKYQFGHVTPVCFINLHELFSHNNQKRKEERKEMFCFNDALNIFLFAVIWH